MTKLKLNLGPQHPSTHGVLRLILELEGEKIISCEPDVGYLHRGMEKMAEKLSYVQYLPLVDRIDYLAGFFYSELLCRTVEKALNVELSEKVKNIRVMMLELNRIASHLLWIGAFLMDLGATSPFFYAFREREMILEFFENVYSSADITFRKPSQKAFEYVLADMNLSPSKDIHFIGNKKEKDVDGALATGLTPILVEKFSDFDGLAFGNLREVKNYFEENYVYINSISENESLVDGPGLRTVVYFQGCTRACPGCHNPSTWSLSCGKRFSLDELIQTLENKAKNKKVTLSGGDPLLQSKALLKLLRRMQEYDVCLYTGGEENDVPEELKKLLRYLKVGPYEKSKRTTTTPFVGSTNQVLIDLRRKNEAINK